MPPSAVSDLSSCEGKGIFKRGLSVFWGKGVENDRVMERMGSGKGLEKLIKEEIII